VSIQPDPASLHVRTDPLPAESDTSPSRVLVVDDDGASLETLAHILRGHRFQVTTAGRAQTAIERLQREPFDLVVTDLYLNGSLGYEVARAARERRPAIPVVLVTGRPTFDGAQRALQSQVAEILPKPIEPGVLVSTCRRAIWTAGIEQKARMLEASNRVLETVMPRVIEAKDPTTSGHSMRVVRYAEKLAVACGVDDSDQESLRLAALLHDVGKIGIPKEILTKAGPLTPDERLIVQAHPEVGYHILRGLEEMEKVGLWVYQHHERWDGKGYPNGLKGDEVELPGRILVLAEVYDALAEPRSYKGAWPVEQIVAFFRENAGTHFDPDLAHLVSDGLEREGKRFFADRPGMLF
jgi:putative two-component system response regulator